MYSYWSDCFERAYINHYHNEYMICCELFSTCSTVTDLVHLAELIGFDIAEIGQLQFLGYSEFIDKFNNLKLKIYQLAETFEI